MLHMGLKPSNGVNAIQNGNHHKKFILLFSAHEDKPHYIPWKRSLNHFIYQNSCCIRTISGWLDLLKDISLPSIDSREIKGEKNSREKSKIGEASKEG